MCMNATGKCRQLGKERLSPWILLAEEDKHDGDKNNCSLTSGWLIPISKINIQVAGKAGPPKCTIRLCK